MIPWARQSWGPQRIVLCIGGAQTDFWLPDPKLLSVPLAICARTIRHFQEQLFFFLVEKNVFIGVYQLNESLQDVVIKDKEATSRKPRAL